MFISIKTRLCLTNNRELLVKKTLTVFLKRYKPKLGYIFIYQRYIQNMDTPILETVKPKRGRKPNNASSVKTTILKPVVSNEEKVGVETNVVTNVVTNVKEMESVVEADVDEEVKQIAKKRGRKPKGGKIVQHLISNEPELIPKQNIILHLKCSLNDLTCDQQVSETSVEPFVFPTNKNDLLFDILDSSKNVERNNFVISENDLMEDSSSKEENNGDLSSSSFNNKNAQKDLWKKVKQLERDLHNNNSENKTSCCFWDTCEFNTNPVHIPKHYLKNSYNVYGCFCSPECAASFLMRENIDSSTKFERYHLLNHIYGKTNNRTTNIRPAPDPYYTLDKYYGNLSIQEYRSLLKKDRLFLILDKPLTKILPELHEDNDDFILNTKVIQSNAQQTKKKQLIKSNVDKIVIMT